MWNVVKSRYVLFACDGRDGWFIVSIPFWKKNKICSSVLTNTSYESLRVIDKLMWKNNATIHAFCLRRHVCLKLDSLQSVWYCCFQMSADMIIIKRKCAERKYNTCLSPCTV